MTLGNTIDPAGMSGRLDTLSVSQAWRHTPTTRMMRPVLLPANVALMQENEQDEQALPTDGGSNRPAEDATSETDEDDMSWGSACPSALRMYLREISRVMLLTAEQEVALAQRVECGDKAAAHALTQANLRLVVRVARGYQNRGLALEDLIAEGNMGLLQAVHKYEWRRGFRFSTYASWWIRQAVVRALADKGRIIRLPVHVGDELSKRNAATHRLTQELGAAPTPAELESTLGTLTARTSAAGRAAQPVISLDSAISAHGDSSVGDLVGDTASVMPDYEVERRVAADEIRQVMRHELTAREHLVLTLRYGLDSGGPQTLAAVGRKLGVTRERTRQIEATALLKLRKPIARAQL